MRRWIARFGVLVLVAAGAVPAGALELGVSASVSPAAATRGQPVTVTAKIKRSDPQAANPPAPIGLDVSFLRVGDTKPFATRRVQLAANATTDVSATWTAAVGTHQFSVSVALAPGQTLPPDAKPRGDTRAAAGPVVVTASPPPQGSSSSDSKRADSTPPARPPTPTDAVPPKSTAAGPFQPFTTTAPGIRVAGGPLPAAGAGGASSPAAPFSPVTVTAPGIRVTGGPVPPAGAVAPFSPVTVTAPPITVRGQ